MYLIYYQIYIYLKYIHTYIYIYIYIYIYTCMHACVLSCFSHVQLFSTLRTVACHIYTHIYVCVCIYTYISIYNYTSNQFSCTVVSNCLWPHGLQHARLPCPLPTPRPCSDPCLSSQWCHPTISSSAIPFSCLQSCPASGSFPMSQFFASGGQSIGASASASVLPMNSQDWFPLGITGLISLLCKGQGTL